MARENGKLTPAKLAESIKDVIINDKLRSIKFKTFFNNFSTEEKEILLKYVLKNDDVDIFKVQTTLEKELAKRKEAIIKEYEKQMKLLQSKIEELKQ
jgi:hypothetical protein